MTLQNFINNDSTFRFILYESKIDYIKLDWQINLRFIVLRLAIYQWIEKF